MKYFSIIVFTFFYLLILKPIFAAPKINIQTLPQQVYKNEEFGVTFNVITDITSSDIYYFKGRVGSSSATLNQGETFNPISNNWLSDTVSWNSFPAIVFLNNNIATASVSLRIKPTAYSGNNLLIIRLNHSLTSYDSSPSALFLVDILTPTQMIEPTPTLPADLSSGDSSKEKTSTPTPTPISYTNIYISEVMPNPPANEHEWVELFNNNDFSVSLTNWFIDDIENGGSSPKLFSLNIPAKNYGLVTLSSSMFNNDGDSVRLLDFNKNLMDSFEYSSSIQGKTYGRISFDSDDFCLQEPSKGLINNSCLNPTLTPQPTPTKTSILPTIKSPLKISPASYSPTKSISTINIAHPPSPSIEPTEEILGSYNEHRKPKHPIIYLSFTSFSYSLLTIVSLFLKMKKGI